MTNKPTRPRRPTLSYKLALQLYRTFNEGAPTRDWININWNLHTSSWQTKFSVNKTNTYKIGMNIFSNRLNYLNGKIDLNLLNLSYQSYKIQCKKIFLGWSEYRTREKLTYMNQWNYCDKIPLNSKNPKGLTQSN